MKKKCHTHVITLLLTASVLAWPCMTLASRFDSREHGHEYVEREGGPRDEHFQHQARHPEGMRYHDQGIHHGHAEVDHRGEQHGHYSHQGRSYRYYHDGGYYNYFNNGAYYVYFINGAYYNYFYNGAYYRTCREVPGFIENGRSYPPTMLCR